MTEYGVTKGGFERKRAVVILAEVAAEVEKLLGRKINLADSSPLGQLHGILCTREAMAWELLQHVYDSQYPDTADGVSLTRAVELTGTQRLRPAKSLVPIGIGYGTYLATFKERSLTIFIKSQSEARYTNTRVLVVDQPAKDAVYTIEFSKWPQSGTFKIHLDTQYTPPINADTSSVDFESKFVAALGTIVDKVKFIRSDPPNRHLVFSVVVGPGLDMSPSLQIEPLDCVSLKTTTGTVPAPSGESIVGHIAIEPGNAAFGIVPMESEKVGAWAVDFGTLTEIATPKVGLDAFSNRSTGAIIGRFTEGDASLKLRRLGELQKFGAATADAIASKVRELVTSVSVIVNSNSSVGTDGQPPHTVEIIIEGGTKFQDIAQNIWNNLTAGILTWSPPDYALPLEARDSQGFPHQVVVTIPKAVEIYVQVDLIKLGLEFPKQSGREQIKDALMAAAKKFRRAQSIVVSPYLLASLADIPGIEDVLMQVRRLSDGVLKSSVEMGKREIASLSRDNILVTGIT